MERLSDNAIEIANELHTERLAYESEYVPIIDALNRLAEYEDIGLEPEKIVFLKNVVDDRSLINRSLLSIFANCSGQRKMDSW